MSSHLKVLFLLALSVSTFAQTKIKNEREVVILKYSELVHRTYKESLEKAKNY